MKQIVIIAGWYYPEPSPTGNCVKQLVNELKKDYQINVVCFGEKDDVFRGVEGVDLFMLSNSRLKLRSYAMNEIKKNQTSFLRAIFQVLFVVSKIQRVIISVFAWPTSEAWYTKKALKLLKKIDNSLDVDTLITVSNPFEAHVCGYKFKKIKPNVNWITYSLDHFTNSEALHRYSVNKRLKFKLNRNAEKCIYKKADYNFVTYELKQWVDKITNYIDNVEAVSFPLLALKNHHPNTFYFKEYSNKINLVYAGALYQKIRNPEYLFRLICKIKDDPGIVLHLFCRGDCDSIINKYKGLANDRIVVHNILPIDKIHEVMKEADILINLGNNIREQKPSKIYEYIATGKPIINIHYEGISYSEIFDKYTLSININQDNANIDLDTDRFVRFCITNANLKTEEEEILENFRDSTPEYVSNKFKQRIEYY